MKNPRNLREIPEELYEKICDNLWSHMDDYSDTTYCDEYFGDIYVFVEIYYTGEYMETVEGYYELDDGTISVTVNECEAFVDDEIGEELFIDYEKIENYHLWDHRK